MMTGPVYDPLRSVLAALLGLALFMSEWRRVRREDRDGQPGAPDE